MAKKPTGRARGRPRKVSDSAVEVSTQNLSLDIPTPPLLGPDGMQLWLEIWNAGKNWLKEEHDRELITQACQIKDEIEQMRRALSIGEVSRVYIATNKQPTTHPYVNQIGASRAMLLSIMATLGLGPEARTRLGLVEAQSKNILTELQERSFKRQENLWTVNKEKTNE
jgi:P27 family predicted phage terminase small subunit